MAKLDDLNLDDTIETPCTADAEEFLADVEQLIDEDHVQYARDFLTEVMETVRRCGRVTEGQRTAVENVDEGGHKGQQRYRRRNW